MNRKNKQEEYHLHKIVCKWLKIQYPKIVFFSDLSGIKLTIGQAKKIKELKSSNGIPDLFIAFNNKKYSGLFIELKKSYDEIYDMKGRLRRNEHLKNQLFIHNLLAQQNFKVEFVWNFDGAVKLINNYINEKN